MDKEMDECTVFIRNLPLDLKGKELEAIFAEVGPVKKAAVIHDKKRKGRYADNSEDTPQISKGFGFVRFVVAADAVASVEQMNGKEIRGKNISVEVAQKRKGSQQQTPQKRPAGAEGENDKPTPTTNKSSKDTGAPEKVRTVRFLGLSDATTEKQLRIRLRKVGKVESLSFVEEAVEGVWPKGRMAKATFVTLEDAKKAIQTLDNKTIHEHVISARFDVHIAKGLVSKQERKSKEARLIVRNLPFKATVEDLAKQFMKFGPLAEIHIPTVTMPHPSKPDTTRQQSRGFAFVQFLLLNDAKRAVSKANGIQIHEREVAVDYAQAKAAYSAEKLKEKSEKDDDDDDASESSSEAPAKDNDEVQSENDEDDDEVQSNDEDDDEVQSENDEVQSENDEDDDEEKSENDDDEDEEKSEVEQKPKKKNGTSKDIAEGRTIFLKNLPFETTETHLKQRFEEYGTLARCSLVCDRSTGLSKGSAFVTFESADSATQAVRHKRVTLLGREVDVLKAVDRNTADTFREEDGRKRFSGRDRRNLYLKDEGLILGGGGEQDKRFGKAERVPHTDLEKRRHAHQDKKKKLANPLFFISPTRLSVRNLDKSVDDGELKQVMLDAARQGLQRGFVAREDMQALIDAHPEDWPKRHGGDAVSRPIVTDVPQSEEVKPKEVNTKVIRDLERTHKASKGYGFVDFPSHAQALAALRYANNNPDLTSFAQGGGDEQRPLEETPRLIVEFAVENRQKIMIQQARRDKAAKAREIKALTDPTRKEEESSKKQKKDPFAPKKLSRGQRQREKRRRQDEDGQTAAAGVSSQENNKEEEKSRKRVRIAEDIQQKTPATPTEAAEEKKKKKKRKRKNRAEPEDDFGAAVKSYKAKLLGNMGKGPSKGAKQLDEAALSKKFESSSKRWFES